MQIHENYQRPIFILYGSHMIFRSDPAPCLSSFTKIALKLRHYFEFKQTDGLLAKVNISSARVYLWTMIWCMICFETTTLYDIYVCLCRYLTNRATELLIILLKIIELTFTHIGAPRSAFEKLFYSCQPNTFHYLIPSLHEYLF